MDVIALHEKGIKNAVATLGTAVTSNHLSKLMRYSNNIFFAFDGDLAGEKAAWKALQNVLPIIREDTRIKFVFFEAGDDPDSYVNKHEEKGFIELNKAFFFVLINITIWVITCFKKNKLYSCIFADNWKYILKRASECTSNYPRRYKNKVCFF